MKIIIGLGNPGEKYKNTRHNLGYMVLDHLLEDLSSVENTNWYEEKREKSLVKKVKFENQELLLAKPITFMNLSGEAVKALIKKYSLKMEDLYVVHDDLDLPPGHIKIRFGGGSAGHNGVQSIIDHLGADSFLRIRIGIGRPNDTSSNFKFQISNSLEDYVLEEFGSDEIGEVRHAIRQAIKNIKLILKKGINEYMSKYNKKVNPSGILGTRTQNSKVKITT